MAAIEDQQMSQIRWLALGSISAAVIAAVVVVLGGSSVDGWTSTSVAGDEQLATGRYVSTTSGTTSLPVTDAATAFAPEAQSELASVIDSSVGDEPAPPAAVSNAPANTNTDPPAATSGSTTSPVATPVQSAPENAEVRLRIPALSVEAAVTPLGLDGAGGFAVPTTASAVGWYNFSAYPGAAGNAVLAGHLNWRGSRGVFDRLDELSAGDMIYVDTASGEVAYRVTGSHSVTAQTPFVDILGERSGPSTLTLFTCGGTFSKAAGEYDLRLVVNAVRV